MPGKRPINADAPAASPAPKPVEPAKAGDAKSPRAAKAPSPPTARPEPVAPAQPKPRRRGKVPAALKGIAGLVLVAIVFLVAAVLGGGGSSEKSSEQAPAPPASESVREEKETPAAAAAEELGYPSFATNNTTRVGGSDPATNAAGVALAVFPSVTSAQRPLAVTLVDEGEWQAAIAAAVLMAAPVRAPLLVTGHGDVPDPTSQALEALDPQGSADTGGAQAFVIGAAAAPDGLKATRAQGSSPAGVAASLAALRDKLFGGPPQHVVIAPEDKPEFAIPAAAWAARSGDPVFFSGAGRLPAPTVKALKRHAKLPVYVLGPSAAISSGVVREIAKLGNPVQRVSGEDPVENSIALARYDSGDFGWNVNDPGHGFVVARSDAPLDAAVAAPLSASGTWGPLLVTDDAGTLPTALREYLLDVKPGYTTDPTRAFYNHVWVIGDQEAIDVRQQAEIDQLAELARIGGAEP